MGGGRGERDRFGVMNAMIQGNQYSLDQESHGFAGFDDAASLHHFGTFFLEPETRGVEMLKPEAEGTIFLRLYDRLLGVGTSLVILTIIALLAGTRPADERLIFLGVEKKTGGYIIMPRQDCLIEAGDVVMVYGNEDAGHKITSATEKSGT